MPRSLSWRIGLSFAVLAIATWVAIGAAMFLLLRGLHADATTATLTDVATPLVVQARQRLTAAGDARAVLADLKAQVEAQGYGVFIVTADNRVVGVDSDPPPADAIRIPAGAGRGATFDGSYRDGATLMSWVAVVLRQPQGLGPRALILATPDRASGDALRDLLAALPAAVVVSLLVGLPIAWLIGRSVTQPLRRLSAAAARLPSSPAGAPPLPVRGPTEVRELTQRFNAMTAELQHTRREEADLLANLRHDLRTPVTVIGGFAAALTDGTASGDDVDRAARAIAEEASRLAHLVDQLGTVERLQAGEASLRPEPIVAADLLVATVERFRTAAAARGVEVAALEAPPVTFAADRLAVDRILGNLVGNALAALPADVHGHVWLAARPITGTPAGDAVALEVTDDGPGFPPGTIDRVFERFYRADPARARGSDGSSSGLGLSIVRELARAHGGEAFAENVAPHGARVSAVLPVVPRLARG
jgi:signal transduction histidine kinase